MTDVAKSHKYIDAIVAWAKGEPIQYRRASCGEWKDYIGDGTPLFNMRNTEWRPAPKLVAKVSVALMCNNCANRYYWLKTVLDDRMHIETENSPEFVCWAIDTTPVYEPNIEE